jgi:hypothetical protein
MVEEVLVRLRGRGITAAAVIGRITGPGDGRIVLRPRLAE